MHHTLFTFSRLRFLFLRPLMCPRSFDGVLEHVLRIDRVLRQPMGHLLLVGEAGAGKTVLSRFVSWMNGLAIFQASALDCFFFSICILCLAFSRRSFSRIDRSVEVSISQHASRFSMDS